MSHRFHWTRLLVFVTGLVNQELLLRNEYLIAENRILRAHLPSRLHLSNAERSTLAEVAKRLGRKALQDIAQVAKPDTILAWYRRLVAAKFDGSGHRRYPGRPRVSARVEALVVRLARENRGWGYDRIVGALANLGQLGGITRHPDAAWMEQVARNATRQDFGYLNGCRYLLHDRDQKFCREFRETMAAGSVECIPLPARSPNLNAYAERWVRSIKEECLSKLILFGESSLRRVVSEYLTHYHQERNHQGKGNVLLFPTSTSIELGSGLINEDLMNGRYVV